MRINFPIVQLQFSEEIVTFFSDHCIPIYLSCDRSKVIVAVTVAVIVGKTIQLENAILAAQQEAT